MDILEDETSGRRPLLLTEENKTKTLFLKKRMRDAIFTIQSTNQQVVSACLVSLEAFVVHEREIRLERYPREHFVMEQACLTALELMRRIRKSRITFLDVREDLGNLSYLHDRLVLLDKTAATGLQQYLRKLLVILAELAGLLEAAAQVHVTEWSNVSRMYRYEGPTKLPLDPSTLIPKLGSIQSVRILGAGGFGSIYKVVFAGSVLMSCKLVPLTKFRQPKLACVDKVVASMISSPYLVKYNSCFASSAAYVTLMEYIRGVDIYHIARDGAVIPVDMCQLILAQLGLAVQYLHYKGFIHRDIKPSNMMIKPGCRIKLIDFDTVKICTGKFGDGITKSYVRKTFLEFRDNESSGTITHLPPEVLNKKYYGRASDWWAVGITSYQFCTGNLPFRSASDKKLKELIKKCNPKFEVGDPVLQALNMKLIVKDSFKRISTARFDDFKKHAFFQSLNWECLDSDESLGEFKLITDLMEKNEKGQYSPTKAIASMRTLKKKRKKITHLSECLDSDDQNPLFTYYTDGFLRCLRRIDDEDSLSETDIFDELEFIVDDCEYSPYRFKDFLSAEAVKITFPGVTSQK